MNRNYWYEVYPLRDGTGWMLTPDEAKDFIQAKARKDVVWIARHNVQLDTRMYGDVVMTKNPYTEGVGYLEAGEQAAVPSSRKVLMSPAGNAYSRLVKKKMPFTIWDRFGSKTPGQFMLHRDKDDESEVWIGTTRPVYEEEKDGNLPAGLELVEDWELKLLEGRGPAWLNS